MASDNSKAARERRAREAGERAVKREKRTAIQQVEVLTKRPGKSRKEIARLAA